MIRKKQFIIGTFIAFLMFTSCVKEEIYNTAHPDKGQINLITDWNNKGSDITIPQSYTVQAGDYTTVLKGERNTLPNLFAPGTYKLLVFNQAEKISVKEAKATVFSIADGYIESLPGWLFSYTADISLEKDKDYTVIATMQQQVRELNLWIEPTGGTANKIASVRATLSGVAQQLNLSDGALSIDKNISLIFTKQPDGKYKATARLLGFVSISPKLTVKVAFTGGAPDEAVQDYDLSNQLKTFNEEKNKPLSLAAQLIETPTATGFTASISDWKIVQEGSGMAD